MGVPSLYRRLFVKYRNRIISQTYSAEYLYIDYNCAIHPAVKQPNLEIKDMHKAATDYLDSIIRIVSPTKGIYVYIDGSAPLGKMWQQRKRRFNKENEMMAEIKNRYSQAETNESIDFNMISPGTEFMTTMNSVTEEYLKGVSSELGIDYIFSGSNVPGEGEHKIMHNIRTCRSKSDKIAVYGLDSDLIVLCLLSGVHDIVLFREVIEFDGTTSETIHGKFLYLLIDELKKCIHENISSEMSSDELSISQTNDESRIVNDFLFLTFFLGNDFVPALPDLRIRDGGIENMISSYCSVKHIRDDYLIDIENHRIDNDFLRAIFRDLSFTQIDRFHTKENRKRNRIRRLLSSEEYKNADAMTKEILHLKNPEITDKIGILNYSNGSWKHDYYDRYFVRKVVSHEVVEKYIQTIFWIFRYYTSGCASWTWLYPYYGSPLVDDILKYLSNNDINDTKFILGAPANSDEQLIYIMPRKSVNLLPERLRCLVTDISSPLGHLFPVDFKLMTVGKTYLWECEPIMLPPELDDIRYAIRCLQ